MTTALDKARSATMSSLQDTRDGFMAVREQVAKAYPHLLTTEGRRLMQRYSQQLGQATDIIAMGLRVANRAQSQDDLDLANEVNTKMTAHLITMCAEFPLIVMIDDPAMIEVLSKTGEDDG